MTIWKRPASPPVISTPSGFRLSGSRRSNKAGITRPASTCADNIFVAHASRRFFSE